MATNSLKLTSIDNSVRQIEVVNFVNAIGTKGDDKIVGANKNSELTGGGGNDTITGGNKKDILTGTDSTARGVGEVDILTGGGGRDKFILGDTNGAYYVGKGNDDYATITDFNLFQDSISIGSLKDYSFAAGGNNTINLYSGKDVQTRDLVAKIQLAGGISTVNSNARSPDLVKILIPLSPRLILSLEQIQLVDGGKRGCSDRFAILACARSHTKL